uniref:Uncharacterized protein n=1 Tax=Amphimedon queenslandica TaxID=400682 RepID=A0A1X7SHS0_AMPQE
MRHTCSKEVCGFLGHAAKLRCSRCVKTYHTDSPGSHVPYSGLKLHPYEQKLFIVSQAYDEELWMKEWDGNVTALTNRNLSEMQKKVYSCVVPSYLRRIPRKIASTFPSFKADQWKSWTLIFSVLSLYGTLGTVI